MSATPATTSGLAISFSEILTSSAKDSNDTYYVSSSSVYRSECEHSGRNEANTHNISQTSISDSPHLNASDFVGIASGKECRAAVCEADTCPGNRSLLIPHGTPSQTAEDLKQILGNANSRLKSGAELSLGSFFEHQLSRTGEGLTVSLEQAKSRSRVSLDIFLHSNTCIHGGQLRGYIQIRVRKNLRKHQPILISRGTLRLLGFESLETDGERALFYQCSASLSDITLGVDRIYSSEADDEGYSMATEGTHMLPFVLDIPISSKTGTPKGVPVLQPGLSIRYIALVSLALKDPSSGAHSIAHFYRDCDVWPRLNPSILLAPTSRPIQVTASESLRMGGNGQVTVTASLHRLHWISGQSCCVTVKTVNNSEKALKTLCLQLIRSTTVFRKGYKFDASKGDHKSSLIAEHLESTTTTKQVAQSLYNVCARGTRGHASAKGWWAGVIPGQTRSFSHHILIPSDALSIARSHLIEVSYSIQVIVSVGTIIPTEVKVSLPIEIVNFLSLDPPHSALILNPSGVDIHLSSAQSCSSGSESPMQSGYTEQESDQDGSYDSSDEELSQPDSATTGHLAARADADDNRSPPRFADLYYSSLQENLDKTMAQHKGNGEGQILPHFDSNHHSQSTFADRVKEKYLQRQALLTSDALSGDQQEDQQGPNTNVNPSRSCNFNPLTGKPAASSDSGHQLETSFQRHLTLSMERVGMTHCDADPTEGLASDISSKQSIGSEGSSSADDPTEATQSPISGVALPDGDLQRPCWKPSILARPELVPQTKFSKALPHLPDALSENDHMGVNHPKYPITQPNPSQTALNHSATPTKAPSPSALRAGSVKDKIRELEELAAKAENDA